MSKVTMFANAKTPSGPEIIDSALIVKRIREGKWKGIIDKLNSLPYGSPEQKEFKSTSIPGIVWQGEFSARNDKSIINHSGLVAPDLDDLNDDEMVYYRESLIKNPHTHILFRSPRRNGLKIIVKIPPSIEDHKLYVGAIGRQYQENAKDHYDHFKDISRLCFVSYDPDIFYREDSVVFTEKFDFKKKAKGKTPAKQSVKSTVTVDMQDTFNKLAVWADRHDGYTDGNKHKHLVNLFAACSRYGIPCVNTVSMAYARYSIISGVKAVELRDYQTRAESVYSLYSHDFATQHFDDSGTPPLVLPQETAVKPTDPVTFFNTQKLGNILSMFKEDLGWKMIQNEDDQQIWQEQDGAEDECTAMVDTKHNLITIGPADSDPFKAGRTYTPFEIVTMITFNGNFRSATEWILSKYFEAEMPYMRIGTDYFKKIHKVDRFGIKRTELKHWTKEEIKQDHGTKIISKIPLFDDFSLQPDHINYQPVVGTCYNLYREFPHRPQVGEWTWTNIILHHIFGDQYEIGIRYMQILYLHPDRLMPILVLVSKKRQTGKTTFLNWLNMVFGDNMANLNPEDLVNGFNFSYAASNIIAIEETLIEKTVTVEKLKALATTKFITVNQKFISQYRMPFFGKIILTSNNENKFAKIDQEEIRFFIRKVGAPTTTNHNIEADMVAEIPAFLHYLTTLPPADFSRDRTGFTPDELENDNLINVKKESRTETCKEIMMIIEDIFLNELSREKTFMASAKCIKDKYFSRDNRTGYVWIRDVLKDQLNLKNSEKSIYFSPFKTEPSRTGRPFIFNREDFTQTPAEEDVPF